MKMSNSKLTLCQKHAVKGFKADIQESGGTFAHVGRFTVVIMPEFPGSSMARMSVAFASENEQKIRRKVGIYHAMVRMYDNQSVPVPVNFDALSMALMMADQYGE
jgi:hypothetical protein